MTAKTVVVTGASRGLGAAIARAAAQMGAAVVLAARSEDALSAVAQAIQAAGGEALAVAGDVSQPGDCRRIVDQAVRRFGRVDALVNNAAVLEPIARLAGAGLDDWERSWAVNVMGSLLMVQAALPELRQRGGRVVNVSSGAAVRVKVGWGAYCTTKAALNALNEVLAKEEPDITSVAMWPGAVDTAMQQHIREDGEAGMSPADYARFVREHREGTLRSPEVPGRAIAAVALHAPHDWSGRFIGWDDPQVQALADQRAG